MALLLLLFLVESQVNSHQCSIAPLSHCTDNSVIRVTKSTEMYQVSLQATEWQCYNGFCLVNDQEYRQKNFTCNDICGACQRLEPPGSNECGTTTTNCEARLDIYLDGFCAQATSHTRNRATINTSAVISAELPCPVTTVHSIQLTTITVSSTLPCQCNKANPMTSVTPQTNTMDSKILAKSVENYMYILVAALGALLALSLLLLAVVTTGWMCTCMLMKKREAKKSSTHSSINRVADLNDDTDDKDNEERFFHNPTYDDTHASTTTQLACETETTLGPVGALINDKNFPETAYDTINLPTQPAADNGQTYDVLNRSQANGSNLATEVGKVRDNENYSQLGL